MLFPTTCTTTTGLNRPGFRRGKSMTGKLEFLQVNAC
jgi:hypothetical protein